LSDPAKSDIDVLIVGKGLTYAEVYEAIGPCEVQLGRPVNPEIYSIEELRRKLKDDATFVARILEQPKIFLIGSDDILPTARKSGSLGPAESGTAAARRTEQAAAVRKGETC
jgi:hypothetical protein